MEILDCTLRDGSHALKEPFSTDAAAMIIAALLQSGVKVIEFGKPSGIGSPKGSVSDEAYLEAALPYAGRGELGMFCNPKFFGEKEYEIARRYRIGFLRVGTNAGTVEPAEPVIAKIRQAGIKARFSLVQAHSVSPEKLAENARKVAGYGAQCVTIMDSTGTMMPAQVKEYVASLVKAVDIPVGFHGHNNLGFSVANAMAALDAGASSIDGALGGLARSAGNAPTEMLCAVLEKQGRPTGIDWYRLLSFIDEKFSIIVPDLKGIPPLDIIFGYAGFHSRNLAMAEAVARRERVNLYRLIVEVMRYGLSNPDDAAFNKAAQELTK
ncbi:MAG: 4-hydroxy-2-oxovalerate aldolase [Thermodesulfobacteriota bacterium]